MNLSCLPTLSNALNPELPPKIGDMGLSTRKKDHYIKGNMRGTLPWMAPELFYGGGSSSSGTDLYSGPRTSSPSAPSPRQHSRRRASPSFASDTGGSSSRMFSRDAVNMSQDYSYEEDLGG